MISLRVKQATVKPIIGYCTSFTVMSPFTQFGPGPVQLSQLGNDGFDGKMTMDF